MTRLDINVRICYILVKYYKKIDKGIARTMSELPEKQIKRLRTLIQEAETNLAAAKELLISIIGDDGQVVTPKKFVR